MDNVPFTSLSRHDLEFVVRQLEIISGRWTYTPHVILRGIFATMDIRSIGSPVTGRRQFKRAFTRLELENILDGSFPPGTFPDHQGAFVIL